ncbi:MAG: hypothetical protein R2939_13915 [Kofleriaceae bacterium]
MTAADVVHFTGTFRYATRAALEVASANARRHLDDDELAEAGADSFRCFVIGGDSLTVDLAIPWAPGPRFVVAAMFDDLATAAVAGSVEARRGAQRVDYFPAGDDD